MRLSRSVERQHRLVAVHQQTQTGQLFTGINFHAPTKSNPATGAVDDPETRGYIKFSQPQRSDPVWNAANCRNRRLFNDRTGLAAGTHTKRFLLQTYRRDMGGGEYALKKDASAPIFVNGRHWGGLRIGYRI